jgi:hypothetical protein
VVRLLQLEPDTTAGIIVVPEAWKPENLRRTCVRYADQEESNRDQFFGQEET